MPNAARIGDDHLCPMFDGPKPHRGGPILSGVPVVLIENRPAATVGSVCQCLGPPDPIVRGCVTVRIGNLPAARQGDTTAHGGVIVGGAASVRIGG